VTAISTAITATATSVAEPRSPRARFDRCNRIGPDRDARQQKGVRTDRRHHGSTVIAQVNVRANRRDVVGGLHGVSFVTAGRETGSFPGGVDTPNLHQHCGKAGNAQHEDGNDSGDGERRLDGGGTAIAGQTLVLSARLMMFVSAVTMESPVTTV